MAVPTAAAALRPGRRWSASPPRRRSRSPSARWTDGRRRRPEWSSEPPSSRPQPIWPRRWHRRRPRRSRHRPLRGPRSTTTPPDPHPVPESRNHPTHPGFPSGRSIHSTLDEVRQCNAGSPRCAITSASVEACERIGRLSRCGPAARDHEPLFRPGHGDIQAAAPVRRGPGARDDPRPRARFGVGQPKSLNSAAPSYRRRTACGPEPNPPVRLWIWAR